MPIHTERPFVIPTDIQVPAMCVEIINSLAFCFPTPFWILGNHMREGKPAHLQTWHLLSGIGILNVVRARAGEKEREARQV